MTTPSHRTDVVITGVAPVTSIGSGSKPFWDALVAGECGIGKISSFDAADFPVTLAGEVHDIDPGTWIDRRLLVQTDRWTHLALAATELVLAEMQLDLSTFDPARVGVITEIGRAHV